MQRGLKRFAYVMASHRISRPSASVLMTSMVWPERLVTMSPGRVARLPGMFSHAGMMATTLTAGCSSPSACIAPSTRAGAAHVELHLVHLRRRLDRDAAGVERRRPCRTARSAPALAGAPRYCSTINRGGSSAPCVTRQQCSHAELAHVGFVEHFHFHAVVALGEVARRFREMRRRADVGGAVAEVARKVAAGSAMAVPILMPARTSLAAVSLG